MDDQYFSAYPSVKVQKDITVPFNAFACASFNILDEELDASAAQQFNEACTPRQVMG